MTSAVHRQFRHSLRLWEWSFVLTWTILGALSAAVAQTPSVPIAQTFTSPESVDQDDMCVWVHPENPALSVIVGSDGGWWLPLLADRANTAPPLNYGTERGPWSGYREWVNDITRQVQEAGIDDPATLGMLEERGITHVYLGQGQGQVGADAVQLLSPEALSTSPAFSIAYHQDRVWVFEAVR